VVPGQLTALLNKTLIPRPVPGNDAGADFMFLKVKGANPGAVSSARIRVKISG
jgi:hypothetical protein